MKTSDSADKSHRADSRRAAVRAGVNDSSVFDNAYLVMNTLATIVACYGLLENSAAVVIGAMIIAMLLGPISGVGLALVDGNNPLLRKASLTLAGGIVIVVTTAFVIGTLNREIPVTQEMLSRTAPNLFDLMIALGGGAAGAYSVISPRLSVAFVGVAIATALVPPLATSSIFLARGKFELAAGAMLLAVTNIVAIQVACSVAFYLSGFRRRPRSEKHRTEKLLEDSVSVAALVILGVVLTANLNSSVRKLAYERNIRNALNAEMGGFPGAFLEDVRLSREGSLNIIRAVVRGPAPFSATNVAKMESSLPFPPEPGRSELRIRFIQTTVMSAKGPLFSTADTAGDGEQ